MDKQLLVIDTDKLKVVEPVIEFGEYERLVEESKQVAEYIDSINLTDENVKDVKKVLAKANKAIKALNDKRIEIKKQILNPYDDFNDQIKVIEKIIKDADERLRFEVRLLDEKEREDKERKIREIWDRRIGQYEYAKLMGFDDFIKPKHLNKSQSVSKSEDEMIDFLEASERDLRIICKRDDKDEGISLYKESKDLAITLETLEAKMKEKLEYKEKLKELVHKDTVYLFSINGKKDKNFVEMLLKENNIEYQVREL